MATMIKHLGKEIEVDPEWTKKWLENYFGRIQKKESWIIEKYFPLHIGHTQEETDIRYFDALFLEKDLTCSCGKVLTIDRNMTDAADVEFPSEK